jgi:hypothetical protein
MLDFFRGVVQHGKMVYLYIARILFAKSHLKVSPFSRLFFNISGGFTGDQVALFGLTRKNKSQYLSEYDWYRSRNINGAFSSMLNNKIICDQVLSPFVRVPTTYLMKIKGHVSSYGNITTINELITQLASVKKMMLKPVGAGKGKGISFLGFVGDRYYLNAREVTPEELIASLNKQDNYYVSEFIEQCDFLNNIYELTSNTIRFVTIKDPTTDEFTTIFAVLRIGTKETIPVDNGSQGGLVVKIDLATGELSQAKSLRHLGTVDVHPDSGAQIAGLTIPDWPAVCQEIISLSKHFPFLHFIAWDVLLTQQGICIVEANTSTGNNIIQIWGGQRQGELGAFYVHHGVIRK